MEKKVKTALVTGASRGIGKGIALALAEAGYDLVSCHFNDIENAEEVTDTIAKQFGRSCAFFNIDLQDENAANRLVEYALETLGHIDLLVNNAGTTIFSPIVNMELEKMNHLINLDLKTPLLLMKLVGNHMIDQQIKGTIINITSTRAERAYPTDAVYGGVKAALKRATESIALELSTHDIRVNCIAPGAIQTSKQRDDYYKKFGKKIPLKRAGTPEDIGDTAVWLASDQASYVTGTTIKVDGGLILPGMPESVTDYEDDGWGRSK